MGVDVELVFVGGSVSVFKLPVVSSLASKLVRGVSLKGASSVFKGGGDTAGGVKGEASS